MKKTFSLLAVILLMSSSSLNANVVNTNGDPFDDCFEFTMSLYNIYLDSGRDRADALEIGAWAYEDCLDDEFSIDNID